MTDPGGYRRNSTSWGDWYTKWGNPMDEDQRSSLTAWDCKDHVIPLPKRRRQVLYAQRRMHLGEAFRQLATQRESPIVEWHLTADHLPLLISIPPKYSVTSRAGARSSWPALLGSRILGIDNWRRRSGDSRVHPQSEAGTPLARSIETEPLDSDLTGPHSSPHRAVLSGSHRKPPG